MLVTRVNNVQTITLAVTAIICYFLCRKINNATLIKIGMCIAVPGQIISLLGPENMTMLLLSAFVRSIGWGLLAALIHSMVADAVEYGHWRTGHRTEGTTYSAQGVGNKLGVLIGGGVTTILLGTAGYDGAKAVQSASALAMIKGIYLYMPLIMAAIILVMMLFYRLTKSRYDEIIDDLMNGKYHPDAMYAPDKKAN